LIEVPEGVRAMARRGPEWQTWVHHLPKVTHSHLEEWKLTADGKPTHGLSSLVQPVQTAEGLPAVLKIDFPSAGSEHEHLVLRRWGGDGAVKLLRANPAQRVMLLERLKPQDLKQLSDVEGCEVVAGLYLRIHVPALPQLRTLTSDLERWITRLVALPRSAPVPRRLVEQAIGYGRDLVVDRASTGSIIHCDLHYQNVLAADREPWLVIDPEPMNGDPHYEVAPMLWGRWNEIAGDVRRGVCRRFDALVEAAGFAEDRARAWVVVRMVHYAALEVDEGAPASSEQLSQCIAIAKAVQR
jgi:streptomycin 6-kinase